MDEIQLHSDRRLVSILMAIFLLPVVWFLSVDIYMYADDWRKFSARLATRSVSVLIPLVGIRLMRNAQTRAAYSQAVLGIALSMVFVQLALNLLRPAAAILPPSSAFTFMFLFALYCGLPNSFLRQVLPPVASTLGFILQSALVEPMTLSNLVILLIVNGLGAAAIYRRRNLEAEVNTRFAAEREAISLAERANAELKTLQRVIPICAWCKKIRSEIGDWQQLESYFREHANADFTHGICPDCKTVQVADLSS